MEDNEDNSEDNRNNNNVNQTIQSPVESTNKQHQIISSTVAASTFAHRLHEGNYNRNKNKKYNKKYNNKYRKGNDNNRYNYYNNHSQHNSSLNCLQKQQDHQDNNERLYQDSLQEAEFTFRPDIPCSLIDFVGGVDYTPSNDNGIIFNRVVKFFRDLTTNIEQEKKILDFNFYLQEDQDQGFYVQIIQSDPTRHPPHKTLNCLSCDSESETNRISRLQYPTTTREEVSVNHNLWIDAKARPMFVITPKRHIERLSECNDQEIFSMFLLAMQTIEQETRLSNAKWNNVRFLRMTLNHGNARNLEHLHLKIRVSHKDLKHFKNCWDEEKKKKFKILESGLYKRDERLSKTS
jgi:diadenosine tetraphosphate (Ap4A) HIT family hydrolase